MASRRWRSLRCTRKGGFLLAFTITISAYATPAILGGPATETLTTLMYTFMVTVLDWSLGSMLGAILIVCTVILVYGATKIGARKADL